MVMVNIINFFVNILILIVYSYHADYLSLKDPLSGDKLVIQATLSTEFQSIVDLLFINTSSA